MSHLLKNLLIASGTIFVLAGVFIFVMNGETQVSTQSSDSSAEIATRSAQVIADKKRLQSYKMDTSIFDEVRFTSLNNFHVSIPDVPTGRIDPFIQVP